MEYMKWKNLPDNLDDFHEFDKDFGVLQGSNRHVFFLYKDLKWDRYSFINWCEILNFSKETFIEYVKKPIKGYKIVAYCEIPPIPEIPNEWKDHN